MYKRLTTNPLFTDGFYVVAIVNTLIIYTVLAKHPGVILSVSMFFGFNIFLYMISWRRYYQFEYNEKFLIVTNSWNPFVSEEIEIAWIRNVEIEYRNRAGFEVMITYRHPIKGFATKGFIARTLSREELTRMIDDIHKTIGRLPARVQND